MIKQRLRKIETKRLKKRVKWNYLKKKIKLLNPKLTKSLLRLFKKKENSWKKMELLTRETLSINGCIIFIMIKCKIKQNK